MGKGGSQAQRPPKASSLLKLLQPEAELPPAGLWGSSRGREQPQTAGNVLSADTADCQRGAGELRGLGDGAGGCHLL